MHYTRIYADADGESHFDAVEVELHPTDYAPPLPALLLSSFTPATQYGFLRVPGDFTGGWHPTPVRQFAVVMAGEWEIETSDGQIRRFGPGSCVLAEDRQGRGHDSRQVTGTPPIELVLVHLAD
jgi:hypothetical protein